MTTARACVRPCAPNRSEALTWIIIVFWDFITIRIHTGEHIAMTTFFLVLSAMLRRHPLFTSFWIFLFPFCDLHSWPFLHLSLQGGYFWQRIYTCSGKSVWHYLGNTVKIIWAIRLASHIFHSTMKSMFRGLPELNVRWICIYSVAIMWTFHKIHSSMKSMLRDLLGRHELRLLETNLFCCNERVACVYTISWPLAYLFFLCTRCRDNFRTKPFPCADSQCTVIKSNQINHMQWHCFATRT